MLLQNGLEWCGYSISRAKDFYSPLPSRSRLFRNKQRWQKPSSMRGITYDLNKMKAYLWDLISKYYSEFAQLPPYSQVIQSGFGPGYTAIDALLLYMLIRDRKPSRYVEVGSGVSTYYASAAAKVNTADGYPLNIKCIEPHPYKALLNIPNIECCQREVQDLDYSIFSSLDANDILFIDSSHVLKLDGDVPFLYLEVLPALRSGVLVHVHDVPFPYNIPYPPELWVFGSRWPMFWNEAMLLQAFLCFNKRFEILMSTPLIRYLEESFLTRVVPSYRPVAEEPNTFSSIWLRSS